MVPLRVLSRTKLTYPSRHSSLNSRPFNLLQPLCRRQKSQLLWNQANPASFCKTPGVGVVSHSTFRRSDLPTFRPERLSRWVTRLPRAKPRGHFLGAYSALPLLTRHGIISPYMEFQRIQNAIDLLGPAPPPPLPREVPPPDRQAPLLEPRLEIAWGGFHQGFWSSVAALFGPSDAKGL